MPLSPRITRGNPSARAPAVRAPSKQRVRVRPATAAALHAADSASTVAGSANTVAGSACETDTAHSGVAPLRRALIAHSSYECAVPVTTIDTARESVIVLPTDTSVEAPTDAADASLDDDGDEAREADPDEELNLSQIEADEAEAGAAFIKPDEEGDSSEDDSDHDTAAEVRMPADTRRRTHIQVPSDEEEEADRVVDLTTADADDAADHSAAEVHLPPVYHAKAARALQVRKQLPYVGGRLKPAPTKVSCAPSTGTALPPTPECAMDESDERSTVAGVVLGSKSDGRASGRTQAKERVRPIIVPPEPTTSAPLTMPALVRSRSNLPPVPAFASDEDQKTVTPKQAWVAPIDPPSRSKHKQLKPVVAVPVAQPAPKSPAPKQGPRLTQSVTPASMPVASPRNAESTAAPTSQHGIYLSPIKPPGLKEPHVAVMTNPDFHLYQKKLVCNKESLLQQRASAAAASSAGGATAEDESMIDMTTPKKKVRHFRVSATTTPVTPASAAASAAAGTNGDVNMSPAIRPSKHKHEAADSATPKKKIRLFNSAGSESAATNAVDGVVVLIHFIGDISSAYNNGAKSEKCYGLCVVVSTGETLALISYSKADSVHMSVLAANHLYRLYLTKKRSGIECLLEGNHDQYQLVDRKPMIEVKDSRAVGMAAAFDPEAIFMRIADVFDLTNSGMWVSVRGVVIKAHPERVGHTDGMKVTIVDESQSCIDIGFWDMKVIAVGTILIGVGLKTFMKTGSTTIELTAHSGALVKTNIDSARAPEALMRFIHNPEGLAVFDSEAGANQIHKAVKTTMPMLMMKSLALAQASAGAAAAASAATAAAAPEPPAGHNIVVGGVVQFRLDSAGNAKNLSYNSCARDVNGAPCLRKVCETTERTPDGENFMVDHSGSETGPPVHREEDSRPRFFMSAGFVELNSNERVAWGDPFTPAQLEAQTAVAQLKADRHVAGENMAQAGAAEEVEVYQVNLNDALTSRMMGMTPVEYIGLNAHERTAALAAAKVKVLSYYVLTSHTGTIESIAAYDEADYDEPMHA